ncbi:MAG: aminotransferase class I/II-fold pyridoxal phosphate-dependent enzyme [Deltaproteobacteria bacterium]
MNLIDRINPVVRNIPPSGIRKFFDVVTEMKDAISLGVGEPDFVTPWRVREAGIYSLEKGHTHYTSNWGLPELREEISKYVFEKYNLQYDPKDEIIVTVGGSEGIDIALRALVGAGDEVLVQQPCFVSYKPCVEFCGALPVVIETKEENQFKLTAKELEEKITPRTKLLIMSFPNNPTGAVMTKQELEPIAEVIKKHDLLVISDEIYSELTYGFRHTSIASLPDMRDRTIVINGFSKAFAMTGWRMGYTCGHKDITGAMFKIHQYAIMCSPTTSQYAAIEALRSCDDEVEMMNSEYNNRRRLIIDGLRKAGLKCFEPLGAFYVFPSIKETGLSSEAFCERLLMEEKLAVVPGGAFGDCGEGFVRMSYAYSVDTINLALERINRFMRRLGNY